MVEKTKTLVERMSEINPHTKQEIRNVFWTGKLGNKEKFSDSMIRLLRTAEKAGEVKAEHRALLRREQEKRWNQEIIDKS